MRAAVAPIGPNAETYSAIMPHYHSTQDLLLNPAPSLFELRPAVRARARLAPLLHRRRVLVLAPALHPHALQHGALRERDEAHGVVGHPEVECAEPSVAALVHRGLHDAVDRALVEPAGEHLHGIPDVDDLYDPIVSANS